MFIRFFRIALICELTVLECQAINANILYMI